MAIRIPINIQGSPRPIDIDIPNDVDDGLFRLFRDLLAELEEGDANAGQQRADERLGRLISSALEDFHNSYSDRSLRSLDILERYAGIREDLAAHRVVDDNRVRQLLEEIRDLDHERLDTLESALERAEPAPQNYPALEQEVNELQGFINHGLQGRLGNVSAFGEPEISSHELWQLRLLLEESGSERALEAFTDLLVFVPPHNVRLLQQLNQLEPPVVARILQKLNLIFQIAEGLDRTQLSLRRQQIRDCYEGISAFLDNGGDTTALTRLLSARREIAQERDLQSNISSAMRALRELSPEGTQRFNEVMGLEYARPGRIIQIFRNYPPQVAEGIFSSIMRFRMHQVEGLHRVIGFLSRNLLPGTEKGMPGQMLAANHLLDQYPEARLTFEEVVLTNPVTGLPQRTIDIVMQPRGGPRFRIEVKEISRWDSLEDPRIGTQLTKDIFIDAAERRGMPLAESISLDEVVDFIRAHPLPQVPSRAPLETTRWRIRYEDLARRQFPQQWQSQSARQWVRQQVGIKLDQQVRDRLRDVLGNAEANAYLAVIRGASFVELF